MGFMDKLKGLTKGREKQISQAVDKAGDLADKRTKGKYSGQIQGAENQVDKALGVGDDGAPDARGDSPGTPRPAV